ncbi:uncharacterized protein LOC124694236 [Lolium rigidum]|uniref:uncharacterized protein LOC124694236 n=1 Tax=Lolium rigidum TaxID=89674 RepID=UPI001F5D4AB9|nr:uncharacterized protein LOC124694236 [Lolium rigidum]
MATVELHEQEQEKEQIKDIKFLWRWRKYLLLLATLVASVTYAAGLNPPGGVRSEEGGNNARGQHTSVEPPVPSGVYPNRVGGVNPPMPSAVYPNRVGDPVLVSTYSRRYTAFFYCNAAAFVASLVVIMFLLDRRISSNPVGVTVLRSAMLLDLLALMAAFAAGSCRDVIASIYVSALFALVFAYVAIQVSSERKQAATVEQDQNPDADEESLKLKDRRKFMLLLATFATPLTYGAGLVPPGGFWSQTELGHRAGAPLLHDGLFKIRYDAFFYANASSFVASLAIIMMLTSRTLSNRLASSYALPVCVLVELLGLMAAFAAGSCRWVTTTVYIVCLVGAVLLYIVLQMAIAVLAVDKFKTWHDTVCSMITSCGCKQAHTNLQAQQGKEQGTGGAGVGEGRGSTTIIEIENGEQVAKKMEESRALLLLLATLAATVTYQAGLSPPGGVWPDEDDQGHLHHIPGNPILHDMKLKHNWYMAFYHCNTAAFVASVVIIIIVQSKELSSAAVIRRAALKTAMILDLFGLMGAYVAGSYQDTTSTIYVCALAVVVFVYALAKVVAFAYRAHEQRKTKNQHAGPDNPGGLVRLSSDDHNQHAGSEVGDDDLKTKLERKRKFLLQLAILAATVTYQSGLNPPGGYWQESKGERSLTAGDPVLLDYYGIRYQVFFYCNATGFMASVAVILLLVNQMLYKTGIRSHALHVCVVVGLLGVMGAYAAGSSRQLRTSIYVFALVAAVVAFLILQILFFVFADSRHLSEQPWLPEWLKVLVNPLTSSPGPAGENEAKEVSKRQQQHMEKHKKSKYLMLLGILAASVTYQAGLAPPGGTWGDDDSASSLPPSPSPSLASSPAGNPILLDSNPARYQAFFYCNATSFVASIVVIMILLQHTVKKKKTVKRRGVRLWTVQTAVVLDLLGLLGAYAAGSCRDWETSAYVIALVAAVGVFITMYVLLSLGKPRMKPVLSKASKFKAKVSNYLGRSNNEDETSRALRERANP